MFKFLTDSIENAIDVGVGLVSFGEAGDFSKESVAKLIADGLTVAVIAHGYGVAEDVIQELLDDTTPSGNGGET